MMTTLVLILLAGLVVRYTHPRMPDLTVVALILAVLVVFAVAALRGGVTILEVP